MRVIAGNLGGRRLLGPPRGAETRPTSDRVREAVFNLVSDRVTDARVLDLFAGTGALGIEALSRGASHVTFVESDRGLCQTIETNLEALEISQRGTIHRRDVRRVFKHLAGPFNLVLIDPPYGHLLEREALLGLLKTDLLAPDAVLVVEHASRETVTLPPALSTQLSAPDTRVYGDTSVSLFTLLRPVEFESLPPPAPSPEPTTAAPTRAGRVAIYAGSFDPPTNGHLDVIRRAARLFDRLVVAVARNVRKEAMFDPAERVEILREELADDPNIEVDFIDGLLVEYARRKGATAVIRGLRAVADFEYEFQMACMNHHLADGVETVFLMTAQEYFYVSSSLVKEVAAFGGNIDPFLPPRVRDRLLARIAERKASRP